MTVPATSLAVTVQEVPNPRQVNGGWVTDKANILSPDTEAKINQLISGLEAQNGSEIAVVTVPETAPAGTPKEFAHELFNYWKIGKAGQNNGVLLLISKGERRVEIETGYGVEGILPDARAGNIIQQEITPRFKQGDFDGGTLAGTKALVVALKADALPTNPRADQPSLDADQQTPVGWLPGIGAGGVLLAFIGYKMSRRPLFIKPEGRSRHHSNWELRRRLYCTACKQPMEKLDSTTLQSRLSKPEQVAQNLGSVSFEGWQCLNCRPHLTSQQIHIRASSVNKYRFRECLYCQELTVESTSQVLQSATEYSEGKRLITESCHCCS